VQREIERLKTWLLSDEMWLQPHIDGYCKYISDKLQNKIANLLYNNFKNVAETTLNR